MGKKKFFTSSTHPFVYTKYGTHIVFVTSSPFFKKHTWRIAEFESWHFENNEERITRVHPSTTLTHHRTRKFSLKDFLTLINGSNFPSFTFLLQSFCLARREFVWCKAFFAKMNPFSSLHMGEIYEPLGKILWILTIFQVGTVFNNSQKLRFLD